jgi:hypothetical protein
MIKHGMGRTGNQAGINLRLDLRQNINGTVDLPPYLN